MITEMLAVTQSTNLILISLFFLNSYLSLCINSITCSLIEKIMDFHIYRYIEKIYLRTRHSFLFAVNIRQKIRMYYALNSPNKIKLSKSSLCFFALLILLYNAWLNAFFRET